MPVLQLPPSQAKQCSPRFNGLSSPPDRYSSHDHCVSVAWTNCKYGVQALAEIEESALDLCIPYLAQILEVLVSAFGRYQSKNLLILFDAVAQLAEAVGCALAHPEIVAVLMPAVLGKWEKLRDDERGLIPCTECICALVGAMGELTLPYIEVLYSRIMRLVNARTVALADPAADPPEFEYPCVSLDLLSCIIETIGAQVAPLLQSTGGVAIILGAATTDPHTEVRVLG